jgi:hypothetical protein
MKRDKVSKPEITEPIQGEDTRFKPGQSGNPSGKPKGSLNRVTLAIQCLLDGEGEELTRKAIELAKEGDLTALKLCLERICPPRKSRPIAIDLPDVKTSSGSYGTKGCYSYNGGKYSGMAYFGTGGSPAQMEAAPAAPKYRISCGAQQPPAAPVAAHNAGAPGESSSSAELEKANARIVELERALKDSESRAPGRELQQRGRQDEYERRIVELERALKDSESRAPGRELQKRVWKSEAHRVHCLGRSKAPECRAPGTELQQRGRRDRMPAQQKTARVVELERALKDEIAARQVCIKKHAYANGQRAATIQISPKANNI